jgi:hypothetical protein
VATSMLLWQLIIDISMLETYNNVLEIFHCSRKKITYLTYSSVIIRENLSSEIPMPELGKTYTKYSKVYQNISNSRNYNS